MKTQQLIELMARDGRVALSPGKALLRVMLPAAAFAVLLLLWGAGLRADLAAATGSLRFDFKVLVNVALLVSATGLLLRVVRPGHDAQRWRRVLWLVPALLLAAVVAELMSIESTQWRDAAVGHNASWCLRMIPILGIAPLLAGIWAMRDAAPEKPALAGAVLGLMSAGLAGSLYALHCTDDSPLFVALWYGIAAAMLAGAGALLGSRALRW
jgi:hypothetical protein